MVDLYADLATLTDEELQQALAANPGDPALPRELTMRRVAKLLPDARRGLLVALWCSSTKPWLEPQSLPATWSQVTGDLGRQIADAGAQKGLEQLRPDLPIGGQVVLNGAIAAARKISGADRMEIGGVAFAIDGLRVLEEECEKKGVPLTEELCRERLGVGLKKYSASVDLCEATGLQHPDDYRRLMEADQVARDRHSRESNLDRRNWSAGLLPLVPWYPEMGYYHRDGRQEFVPKPIDPEEHAKEVIRIINASRRAGVMPLALEQEKELGENLANAGVEPSNRPYQRADGSWACPNGGRVVWDEVPNMIRRETGEEYQRMVRRPVEALWRELNRELTAELLEEGLAITFESLQARRIQRLEADPSLAERFYETVPEGAPVKITEEVQDGTRLVPRCAATLESIFKVREDYKKNPESLRRLAVEAFAKDEKPK